MNKSYVWQVTDLTNGRVLTGTESIAAYFGYTPTWISKLLLKGVPMIEDRPIKAQKVYRSAVKDIETGTTWLSVTDCAKDLGFSKNYLNLALRRGRRITKGYRLRRITIYA